MTWTASCVRGAAQRVSKVCLTERRSLGGVFVVRTVEFLFDFTEELIDAGCFVWRGTLLEVVEGVDSVEIFSAAVEAGLYVVMIDNITIICSNMIIMIIPSLLLVMIAI